MTPRERGNSTQAPGELVAVEPGHADVEERDFRDEVFGRIEARRAVVGHAGQPSGHRVLIVDDNRDFAASLQTLLLRLGNEVQVAGVRNGTAGGRSMPASTGIW